MKVRNKKTGCVGSANSFNLYSLSEIIVYFDGVGDTDYISNYDVWLAKKKKWMDMNEALSNRSVITDNLSTHFFEPKDDTEKKQGWGYE